jgi:outer membrane receptor protein involved in Fe transport
MKANRTTMLRTTLLASVATAACLTVPGVALAQSKPAAAAAGAKDVDVQEVVVTGSRIRRDTFDAPLPIASVSGEQLRASGNVILGDLLMEQPLINANNNSQNTSSTLFNSGEARADIRGLGSNRTLVLMDGRRHVNGDAASPAVDLNMIPSLMIDRVEVLPGGQSAVYGSEAIAGVVNLIMKKSYDGLQVDVQGGISQEGDGSNFIGGVIWGKKFMDDRLSVVVGGEYARENPIYQVDRADQGLYPGIRRNSATGVVTQGILPASRSSTSPYATFEIRPDAGVSLANPFGTNNPIAATVDVRNPTQIVQLSPACALRTVNPACQDPSLFFSGIYNELQNETMRGSVRGYTEYHMTDHMKAFAEASFARVDAFGVFQPAFSSTAGGGTLPVTLKGDNGFLAGNTTADQQLRALITGAGLPLTSATSINVGKFYQEFGGRNVYTRRHTERFLAGMEGDFDFADRNFHWDWYAQLGRLTGTTQSFGVPNIQKTLFATDAVLSNGQVVCRATLPGAAFNAAAAGCVPFDLINGASPASIAYANGVATTTTTGTQKVVAGNLTFDLIRLPAGPLGVAIGAEHREEKSAFVQDPISATGALFFNAIGTRAGEFSVNEYYGEARVPILKDLFMAKDLSVEFAARAANYSTIGSANQYRAAAEWAPVQDIRFRASQATAVRAPNIVELFSPQSRNFTTAASDPCDATVFAGASAAQQAARRVTCAAAIPNWNPATFQSNIGSGRPSLPLLQGGNPDLGPETAHTYGLGAVIQPRWVPNLQLSIDYFKYNIANAVGTIPINTLFQNLCYDSTQPLATNPYCALIQRDKTGTNGGAVVGGVIQVVQTNQNVAKIKVEGYDYSAAYHFDIADVLKGHEWGRIGLRLDATWMYRYALQGLPGQLYTQFANTINNATPEWKAVGNFNWTYDRVSVNWTTHYIGSMISNNALLPTQLSPYMTGDYYEHDLRAVYRLNDQIELRGGVLNITDQYPPYLPETYTGTTTGASSFDNRGRFFFVGATLRY